MCNLLIAVEVCQKRLRVPARTSSTFTTLLLERRTQDVNLLSRQRLVSKDNMLGRMTMTNLPADRLSVFVLIRLLQPIIAPSTTGVLEKQLRIYSREVARPHA